jgi:hypothetical protein
MDSGIYSAIIVGIVNVIIDKSIFFFSNPITGLDRP